MLVEFTALLINNFHDPDQFAIDMKGNGQDRLDLEFTEGCLVDLGVEAGVLFYITNYGRAPVTEYPASQTFVGR